MIGRFFIKTNYVERLDPHYFPDAHVYDQQSQPDVYPRAVEFAERAGVSALLDLGCGQGRKLDAVRDVHPEWRIAGVDYGMNIAAARDARAWGTWMEGDLGAPDQRWWRPLARDAVIVCADVIEHLVDPSPLLWAIRLAPARLAVLSTPERDLTWGTEHAGPPPNECHVREWNRDEFRRLLQWCGLVPLVIELTRDSDTSDAQRTMLAVVTA